MSRNVALIGVLFVLGAIGFVQAELQEAERAPAERVVSVSNFPNPQNVVGTVNVGNLPAVQTVTGTVAVSSIPAAPPAARMQLVGFTAATFTGGQGTFGFTSACQTEFGGASRMCLLPEALTTTALPNLAVGTDRAWIQPTEEIAHSDGGYSNCKAWGSSSSNQTGSVLFKTGVFAGDSCTSVYSVACCAPV